ncbi:ExbD/TolR family protein [Govanella unica]|uniref:Biopolymer transporter ExbD n=1 Tax=Govanella unica TaxID=2975056 RepID=A0A9X3U036_9PROT|nr:biopolymer transporter ExbD [Govania unica]MDA5194753.1 biopolymer transporter ExbD [Govania unica]
MGMNVSSGGDDEVMVDMNTTPLIDVMLVLLVMLIITIPIQTHAVKLDMPRPNMNQKEELVKPEVVNLEVDFDGTVIWNGTPVTDQATLNGYLSRAANTNPQPEVHLRPNRLAKYDHVARVLASAQRLGVLKIGFVGNEQYMD